ncbi:MAG: methylmalonyl-CoA mutase small subunit [Chlorobi bacterium]|nr:methylmalonyl-CoA mutase small subunit [Chlorobiota bacterium]
MQEKETRLFSDFPPVTTKEWMEKIKADLKGADFDKKLVWRTREGFSVKPFYREEDLENLMYLNVLPGEFPYVRGNNAKNNTWLIRQDISVYDIKEAATKARELTKKGVDSIGFIIEKDELFSPEKLNGLLEAPGLENTEINFNARKNFHLLGQAVLPVINEKISGTVNLDPLGVLTVFGKVAYPMEQSFDFVEKAIRKTSGYENFRPLNINALNFGNAGATIVQELAFAMAMGSEYLSQMTDRGLSPDDVAKSTRFNFSIGSSYFMEIAKLRAARLLWANIAEKYGVSEEAAKMYIHCETAGWNKTIYDPYVNMLRTQTEAMSAVLGGTDSLTVLPFDIFYKEPDEFSERIARNQQLLLKEESYFDKVEDVAAGSYYIENLTDSIAAEAWKLFVETEENGGYLNALRTGTIQSLVKDSAEKRRQAVATRREKLLGTNEYPNTAEEVITQIERVKKQNIPPGEKEVEPIQLFRGAEEYEELRLETEKSGEKPKVFMLTFGNLAMRLARSQFSGNFFGCAGYEIIDNIGFDSIEQGVEEAKKAGADIVVLCSSDDEYTEAAPKALELLNGEAMLVVAGAPKNMDELKAKGVEHFIHLRSNVLETLKMFNKELTQRH